MADIAKFADVSMATPTIGFEHSLSGQLAGEDLEAGDAVALGDDGLFYLAGGIADPEGVGARPVCHGWVLSDYYEGQAVTLFDDVRMHYAEALTPGQPIFLSAAVPGAIADAAPWTGAVSVGFAVDEMRVWLRANWQFPTTVAVVP